MLLPQLLVEHRACSAMIKDQGGEARQAGCLYVCVCEAMLLFAALMNAIGCGDTYLGT
jgi:hypothetical protein